MNQRLLESTTEDGYTKKSDMAPLDELIDKLKNKVLQLGILKSELA